ncbi:E3 ubiquitin-protein ligase TRIM56-like [Argonauta hians]
MNLCTWCATKHNLTLHMDCNENVLNVLDVTYPEEPDEAECSVHSGEYLQVFCVTCTKDICIQCYYKSHYRHKTKPLREMLSTFNELTEKEFQYLDGIKEAIDVQLLKLDLIKNTITISRDEVLKEIYDSRDRILHEMHVSVNEQVKRVNLWESQLLHVLERHCCKLKNCYRSIERGSKVFEGVKNQETNFPTMSEFSNFFNRIEAEQESLHRRTFALKKIKFHQKWRLRFRPFFGAFFGYPYYETENVEVFPRITEGKQKAGFIKLFLRLFIFLTVILGIVENFTVNIGATFWVVLGLQSYLLLSFILCW